MDYMFEPHKMSSDLCTVLYKCRVEHTYSSVFNFPASKNYGKFQLRQEQKNLARLKAGVRRREKECVCV